MIKHGNPEKDRWRFVEGQGGLNIGFHIFSEPSAAFVGASSSMSE
jgi:hypothetical protein